MSDRHDQILDARAELAGEGIHMTTREAVAASLNSTHGNSDLYPVLRDATRHPFQIVPTDGHPAPAFPSAGASMTPDAAAARSPRVAAADGSPDLPDLAA